MKMNPSRRRILFLFAVVGTISGGLRADQLRFDSTEKRVSVVELFTSEGCSSCPPAERTLSTLKTHPSLWTTFVPIAFHVNYWDNLGWKDRFASVEFTQRQHTYASGWGNNTVYTPEFVLNGREWQWSGEDTLARQSGETPGVLTVLQNGVGDNFVVTFNPTKPIRGQAIAHLALIGFGVSSHVARGENAGRKLTHDFVALAHHETALHGSPLRAELKLDEGPGDSHPRAIAAWVSIGSDPTPIQATGGWISQVR
jgi:hypothetical protein